MIDIIINFMNSNDNYIIIHDINYDLISLQKILCKKLNNCYIYTFINNDNYHNIAYQIYNNKIFCLYKQNNKCISIWKIK
jgi:hypothetical protein